MRHFQSLSYQPASIRQQIDFQETWTAGKKTGAKGKLVTESEHNTDSFFFVLRKSSANSGEVPGYNAIHVTKIKNKLGCVIKKF